MSNTEEFSRLSPVKQCPICGGKLDKGYYHAPRGVYWSDKTHRAGMIALDYVMPGALWISDIIPALKCEKCGIAISDLRSSTYTPKSFLKKCIKCAKEIPIASEECQYCGIKQSQKANHPAS